MPSPFTITVASDSVRLDGSRGQATFTVANTSGNFLRARAEVQPQKPEAAAWLSIVGDAERPCPAGAVEQVAVAVQVPPGTPEGDHMFRLCVADVADPNERFTMGPTVAFKVAGPIEPIVPRRFPWWILIGGVAFLFLLILGGIVTWLVLRDPVDQQEVDTKPARLVLPDFVGEDAKLVVQKLHDIGLRNIIVLKRPGTETEGTVVAQDPPGGIEVVGNTRVTLTVRE